MSYTRSKRNTHKKKYFWLIVAALLGGIIYVIFTSLPRQKSHNVSSIPSRIEKPKPEAPLPPLPEKFESPEGSIFVPYWKVTALSEPILPKTLPHKKIRHIVYFGVTPSENGALDKSEPGYTNLPRFTEKVADIPGSKLLTIRMMNEDTNEAILGSAVRQETLIDESLDLAQQYGFDGLIFDLEHSVLPTKDTVDAITGFLERAATSTHARDLTFALAIYGDTFYRQRPYDVKTLASFSDEIMIMAYDFHKSYGEPGPNFPLFKGSLYPYDFTMMVDDFLQVVPKEKITVIFGLFGYDWSVDDQNRPAKSAKALTLNNIESTLIPTCTKLRCTINRDTSTQESHITYTDASGQKHTVWYEDRLSIKAKASFLSTKNIPSIGYWAFGYY